MLALKRDVYLDHLRGFMFAFMAFDHALHAYALDWGKSWFFEAYTFERSSVWDGFYLFDQSIIMPMLFFIAGLYVVPSLQQHGFLKYIGRRFLKLGVPFMVCIPLIVPALMFPRFLQKVDSSMDYVSFLQNIFLNLGEESKLQAGPLWVCYGLFLYSFILIALYKLKIVKILGDWVRKAALRGPILGLLGVIIISAVLLGVSDVIWGAPWWTGFGHVFYLQGARFLLYLMYFILGGAVHTSGLLRNGDFMRSFTEKWRLWLGCMILSTVGYIFYALEFSDVAYNNDFRYGMHHYFQEGGTWEGFWGFMTGTGFNTLWQSGPAIFIRTSLHGVLCLFQVLFLISFFYKFCHQPTPLWQSLARSCYAIFLTHEAMVIWLQYELNGVDVATVIKIIVIFGIGLGGSWLLSEKILLKIPGLRRVLN